MRENRGGCDAAIATSSLQLLWSRRAIEVSAVRIAATARRIAESQRLLGGADGNEARTVGSTRTTHEDLC
jgi:hypothetical protein